MGDRAVVIFTDGKDVSPAIYLHWNGTEVPKWLEEHKELMKDRGDDLQYATARFIGLAHSNIKGNLSLGCWNTEKETRDAVKTWLFEPKKHTDARHAAYKLLEEYSHGDAGVVMVNTQDYSWQAIGGYLEKDKSEAA